MKNKTKLGAGVFSGIIILAFLLSGGFGTLDGLDRPAVNGEKVTIHKSPTCGCCGVYASYLGKLGYEIEIHDTENLGEIKTSLKIPGELASCHTSEVAGYVVEGHIPEIAIQKLLSEKPDIKGIGLAGMPSGSSGMPGPKTEKFVIYEITHDGTQGEVFTTI